jgi:DNA (cytosine-5)-methyltransferase 1
MRPLLLDLFCGAGGAAAGYYRAGFDIVGVDINAQPNYPFHFLQYDVSNYLKTAPLGGVAAIHASPPCQFYSDMSACRPGLAAEYPDLIAPTRELLQRTGLPWVMENVEGSTLVAQPSLDGSYGITLCGHMFGLKLYRHRLFESSIPLVEPPHARHLIPGGKAGHWKQGEIISVSGNCSPIKLAREAMGIDWMTRTELAEAVPPAYTEYIGTQLLDAHGVCVA